MKMQCVVLLLLLRASRLRATRGQTEREEPERGEGRGRGKHNNLDNNKKYINLIYLNYENTAWIQREFIASHACNAFFPIFFHQR